MEFYLLHKKSITEPKFDDFDYLLQYYKIWEYEFPIEIENDIYCPHDINKKTFNWNYNSTSTDIDSLTHEGGLLGTFEKIVDDKLELWKRKRIS